MEYQNEATRNMLHDLHETICDEDTIQHIMDYLFAKSEHYKRDDFHMLMTMIASDKAKEQEQS